MQLRLACNSPHHFYWPWHPNSDPDRTLITASGKMTLLDRLVPYLFSRNHKVIIFSQFSKQLDILEDWASVLHSWPVCRIDGGVPAGERAAQIDAFNTHPDHQLFLLSTRAGGLGINLTAADTVILYDSDWNPQQDLQAQDRAHRIGQTRPVIVYRLATKGTIEQTLLEKADGKRRLEKLVIQKGKFRSLLGAAGTTKKSITATATAPGGFPPDDEFSELQRLLANDDFENYTLQGEVLTDRDLEVLTDRSDAAFLKAASGGGSGDGDGDGDGEGGEKFRTVKTKVERDGDILGGLM
jgi:ATP-dependent DNA helicase